MRRGMAAGAGDAAGIAIREGRPLIPDSEARAQRIEAGAGPGAQGRGGSGGPHAAPGRTGGWIPPIRRAMPCGARTRKGGSCRAPAVRGKHRCRMHGGAAGAGAPRGNRNALKHGYWSAAEAAARRRSAALAAEGKRMLEELAEGAGELCGPRSAERRAGAGSTAADFRSGADGGARRPLPRPDT